MVQIALIGIAAGVAAALLLASFASGSLLSVFLFYLAPLPVMIAALGWSYLAGLIAAVVAAASLAAVFGGLFCLAFLIGVALPAWWLSYLALLARPGAPAGPRAAAPGDLEWYPVGRLVIWAALLGSVVGAIFTLVLDPVSFRVWLKRAFELLMRASDGEAGTAPAGRPGGSELDQFLDFLVVAIPPTAAAVSTLTSLGNLWLAGQIVKVSGRLRRPWPALAAMAFPRHAGILLAVAVAGILLPEISSSIPQLAGRLSGVLVASLLMAYALLGLAVLHATTRGLKARGLVLAGTYATVAVLGWPVLVMTAIGLADSALDIRGRVARKRGPPATPQ